MTTFSAKPGFALPAVLFIAVLGILLGFGRLLVFNNQCRLRLDRQQELEKVFVVRSALNRLQNWSISPSFPVEGGTDDLIVMCTDSGREVKALIHPADAIFPDQDNDKHFCVDRETKANAGNGLTRYVGTDYRYGSSLTGDHELKFVNSDSYVCLMPTNAVFGDVCRLSLDMSDTGRWSDDTFGRRYAFNVNSLCGTNEHDLVRLILRRKRRTEIFGGKSEALVKGDESWRPSQDHESVIWAELKTRGSGEGSFSAWTQSCVGTTILPAVECVSDVVTNDMSGTEQQLQNIFGIQLVGRRLTLFKSFSSGTGLFRQYNFAGSAQIPEQVYIDFTNDMKTAVGDAALLSTNMVMELEVVASASRDIGRTEQFSGLSTGNAQNQFSRFEVYPAFEFEIRVENKSERQRIEVQGEPKLATVVHLEMDATREAQCTAFTYDTHGTEIKGWRTDERKAWGVIK